MTPQIEKLNVPKAELGEGPHWDVDGQCLYYVDILGASIHKFVPSTGKHTKATFGKKKLLIFSNLFTIYLFKIYSYY